jgi:hypothetical protein
MDISMPAIRDILVYLNRPNDRPTEISPSEWDFKNKVTCSFRLPRNSVNQWCQQLNNSFCSQFNSKHAFKRRASLGGSQATHSYWEWL